MKTIYCSTGVLQLASRISIFVCLFACLLACLFVYLPGEKVCSVETAEDEGDYSSSEPLGHQSFPLV